MFVKIEIKSVTKQFGKNVVIKEANLVFESGNIYGFVGRNGIGKSVIMKLICGYLKPTTGIVLYDGKILNKDIFIPTSTRCLIENPSFIANKSGYQNLELLASIQRKIGKTEIEDALVKVHLFDDKDKKYSTYSLGMKQKLGIAQVLMENPEVMVLDEPFNGIEEETVFRLRDVLLEEKKKGKIIILSSHIKEDIDSLANVVYKIENGNITCIRS